METWEFLIQKEGDRSWLPLESPDVEVLEGRYRVVARSSRVNTAVEVCITHIATAEDPPKRRVQKRTGKTNADGLIVVIPFTRLQPGIWELRCTGDLMSDLMGESWKYAVKLQVLSHATQAAEDWEPDWQHEATAEEAEHQPIAAKPTLEESVPVEELVPVELVPAEPAPPVPAEPALAESSVPSQLVSESAAAVSSGAIDPDVTQVAAADEATFAVEPEEVSEESKEEVETFSPKQPVSLPTIAEAEQLAEQVAKQATDLEAAPIAAKGNAAIASSPIFQMAEQMSSQIVDSIFQEFDQAVEQIWEQELTPPPRTTRAAESATADNSSATSDVPPAEPTPVSEVAFSPEPPETLSPESLPLAGEFQVQLTLEQETYMARRGQTLRLSGQIQPLTEESDAAALDGVSIPAAELQVRLRDPQTAQTVAQVKVALSAQALPLPFDCEIIVPTRNQTQLLLGDVLLVTTPETDEAPLLLGTQAFQVTADVSELLEAIASTTSESNSVQPPLEFMPAATSANLDLTFLELLQSPRSVSQFQPSNKKILPPQLHSSKPSRTSRSLQLPTPSSAISEGSADRDRAAHLESVFSSSEISSMHHGDRSTEPQPSLADVLLDSPVISPQDWEDSASKSAQSRQQADISTQRSLSPEDAAFQSLNLQSRFWSRLNALASDTELSNWLRADSLEPSPSGDPPVGDSPVGQNTPPLEASSLVGLEPLPPGDSPVGLDTDLTAQEVVVDDEPPPPTPSWTIGRYQPQPGKLPEPPKPVVLPEDEPVPSPDLEIPVGELTAGETIFVTVKLPNVKSRIYVKLWMHDRQTRSLLDGPHWLVAFVPGDAGQLETRTQLTVPYGCLEVQFEAIAVEMATQRESHKVTAERKIIPPDMPDLSLDELLFGQGLQDADL